MTIAIAELNVLSMKIETFKFLVLMVLLFLLVGSTYTYFVGGTYGDLLFSTFPLVIIGFLGSSYFTFCYFAKRL